MRTEFPDTVTSVRKPAASTEQAQKLLLNAISDASLSYINGRQNVRHIYGRMLDDLLAITESQYGLVGEVQYDGGVPFIGEHALTCTSWDDETQARYDFGHKDHILFRNVDPLFGESIQSREARIVNNPTAKSTVGFPHPAIRNFIGIPILNGLEVVGVIGLANRVGGFDPQMAEFLKPIVSTCANITVAWRIESRNRVMEKQLAESSCMMRTLVDRTPSAVMYETADRRLEFVNDRFGHLFGVEASPAQLTGLDASLVVKHSARLFADPARFHDRVEDLIAGEESFYGELIEMLDGRLFIRDFVVVRSGSALCGFFWHYREAMTPFDE